MTTTRCRTFDQALTQILHLSTGDDIQVNGRFHVPLNHFIQLTKLIESFPHDFNHLREHPQQWALTMNKWLFNHPKQLKDIKHRALTLLQIAVQHNYQDIIYLDGHGRLTACLLELIYSYNLQDQIKLICVEIDTTMNSWHQLLFPKSVSCHKSDIFHFIDQRHSDTHLIYLNLCGVALDSEFAYDLIIRSPHIMVSFSNRCGCGQIKGYGCRKCHIRDFCLNNAKQLISDVDKSFLTFIFE